MGLKKIRWKMIFSFLIIFFLSFYLWPDEENQLQIEKLKARIKEHPYRLNLYPELAKYLLWENQELEALKAYEKYYQYGGRAKEALLKAGQISLWNQKEKEAIAFFREYLKRVPQDKKILKTLAQLLSWNNKLKESLFWTKKFNSLYQDEEMKLLEARLESWLGNLRRASELYLKILKENFSRKVLKEYVNLIEYDDPILFFSTLSQLLFLSDLTLVDKLYLKGKLWQRLVDLNYFSLAKRKIYLWFLELSCCKDYSFFTPKEWFEVLRKLLKLKEWEKSKMVLSILKEEDKRMYELGKLLISYLESKVSEKKIYLEKIKDFALKNQSPLAALFYWKNTEDNFIKRLQFWKSYQGPRTDELLGEVGKYFIRQKRMGIARKIVFQIKNQILKDKLLLDLLSSKKEKVKLAQKILLEEDLYDDKSLSVLKKFLSSHLYSFWEKMIIKKRKQAEERNLANLKKYAHYFRCEEAYSEWIQNLIWANRKKEAFKAIKEALKLFPDSLKFRVFLWRLKDKFPISPLDVEKAYQQGLISRVEIADYYFRNSQYRKALKFYQKDGSDYSFLQLIRCYLNLGEWGKISKLLKDKRWNSREGKFLKIEYYQRIRKWNSAYSLLRKISYSDLFPADKKYYLYLKSFLSEKIKPSSNFKTIIFKDSEKILRYDYFFDWKRYLDDNKIFFSVDYIKLKKDLPGNDYQNLLQLNLAKQYNYLAHYLKVGIKPILYDGGANLIKPYLEWGMEDKFFLYCSYLPLLDTPDVIEEGGVKKVYGLNGKTQLGKRLKMEYRAELMKIFDGNDGRNYHFTYTYNPSGDSPVEFVYEHDYLDYTTTNLLNYYSPDSLFTDSYGLNFNYKLFLGSSFLALRRSYQSDKNEGWNLYSFTSWKKKDWRLNLEIGYSSSVSGRFYNARYRSNYWSLNFNKIW